MRRHKLRSWKSAAVLAVAVTAVAVWATSSLAASHAATVKVAIMTDCKGAFGFGYELDIGGAQAAFAQYAHGKPTNRKKPSAGMTNISVNGTSVQIVGYGCGNDTVPVAVTETKRLMEKLGADVMVGPLSGDEAVYVANYAKAHPTKTFIIGTAGSEDPTMQIHPNNLFRYHGDGAQWNAGVGEIAYKKLGWKKAAIIVDDYSFGWTSAAGMILDFCAVGGNITKRVFPPLNTTDYAPCVRQLPPPTQVDGYFSAVGGTGTSAMLKAYEQAYGKLDPSAVDRQPVLRLPRRRQDHRAEVRRCVHRRHGHGPGPEDGAGEGVRGRDQEVVRPGQAQSGRPLRRQLLQRRLGAGAGSGQVRWAGGHCASGRASAASSRKATRCRTAATRRSTPAARRSRTSTSSSSSRTPTGR